MDYSVNEDVAVGTNASRPLDVDEMFPAYLPCPQRFRTIEPGGRAADGEDQEPDPAKKMRIGQQLQSLTAVEVEVHFNSAVSIDASPPGDQILHTGSGNGDGVPRYYESL